MYITSNIDALVANNAINQANSAAATSSERLSTGLRLNSAKDDPSLMAPVARLKARVLSYSKVLDNINAGIGMVQAADTALSSISTLLISMRSAALSSANGTTSASTRTDNQSLLSTYRSEIDSIAQSTKYNGYSLLNGSLSSTSVQSGVETGQVTTLSFSSALSSVLGRGSTLSLSSSSGSANALSAGDLLINGIDVGATSTTDDGLSLSSKSGSAIAKAAAINRLTGTTNVVAQVGPNSLGGSSMVAVGADKTAAITINGVSVTASLLASNSIDANRDLVVAAINAVRGQSGVSAAAGSDTTKGVVLTAADGRNITFTLSGATTSDTGLATQGTYAGSYTLRSLSGDSFTLSSTVGKSISNAGLVAGTYSSTVPAVNNLARSGATSTLPTLASGDLLINGIAIGAVLSADDTATSETTYSKKSASAIALAAAINRVTSATSVTATADPNVVNGTGFTAGAVDTILLNGVSISASLTADSSRSDVVTLLNGYTGQTGVVARDNGSGVSLTASDGRNISIGVSSGGAGVNANRIGLDGLGMTAVAATSGAAMAFVSTVRLTSDRIITLDSGTNGASNFQALGFRAGTFGGLASDQKLTTLDISTQTGGSNALGVLDEAISLVSSYRSRAGAQLNRLGAESSLATATNTVNTSTLSKLQDADLAAETTRLASAKMIASSATAMLAQANASKDIVNYLLKRYIG